MDEDLFQMTRDDLIEEVRRLRQGIRQHRDSNLHELCWHHPSLWGVIAGKDRSDPCSAGMAGVHQRLRQVSAVTGRAGPKRPTDE